MEKHQQNFYLTKYKSVFYQRGTPLCTTKTNLHLDNKTNFIYIRNPHTTQTLRKKVNGA